MKKKHDAKSHVLVGPAITIFKIVLSILLNKKEQNEKGKKRETRQKEEQIIVVMASRRRAMKELGRVTFPPDTTSGGGSPRVSLSGLPKREREFF